jgi:hypothetical protein
MQGCAQISGRYGRAACAKGKAQHGEAVQSLCHAIMQEAEFGRGRQVQRQKLQPIGDGPQRAGEIMADPRRDQGCEGRIAHGWGAALMLWEPGMLVRAPAHPEWGIGQIQSVVGERVTVNFQETGKMVIETRLVELDWVIQP